MRRFLPSILGMVLIAALIAGSGFLSGSGSSASTGLAPVSATNPPAQTAQQICNDAYARFGPNEYALLSVGCDLAYPSGNSATVGVDNQGVTGTCPSRAREVWYALRGTPDQTAYQIRSYCSHFEDGSYRQLPPPTPRPTRTA